MSATDAPLTPVLDGLWATPTARLPYQRNVLLRSYLLDRDDGPVLIYNSPGIDAAADAIAAHGGATRLLINHAHEAMYGDPTAPVPTWVHERDRREVTGSMRVAGIFTERETIGDDLEVIPTPGHTAGTTSYLWDSGDHRILFTGDFVWIEDGQWKAVVLDKSLRSRYLESLALVRDLDFDVLVPWGVTEGDAPMDVVTHAEAQRRIDAIIARVERGESR